MKSLFFYPAESAAAFLFCHYKGPAIRERIKEQCIMQQSTINFTAQQVRARVSLADKVRGLYRSVNRWLDARSAFYSRIAEFEVTRRVAIRIGVVFPLTMVVAAVCVEQNPLVSITAMGVSGWIVYRLNKGEKGGEK